MPTFGFIEYAHRIPATFDTLVACNGSNVFEVITSNESVEMAPRRLTEETCDCICTESNLHISCIVRYTVSVKTSKKESKQCTKSCMPACQAALYCMYLMGKEKTACDFQVSVAQIYIFERESRCKLFGMGHMVKSSFVFIGILTNYHIPVYSNRRPHQSVELNPHR